MNVTALAQSATTQGQAAAEGLMTDTGTLTRSIGNGPLNPSTGTYDPPPPTTLYSGKCRVKPRDVMDHQVEASERPVQIWPYVVSLPMTEVDPTVGDLFTIVTSVQGPALAGVVLVVKDVARGSQITARRLGCVAQVT